MEQLQRICSNKTSHGYRDEVSPEIAGRRSDCRRRTSIKRWTVKGWNKDAQQKIAKVNVLISPVACEFGFLLNSGGVGREGSIGVYGGSHARGPVPHRCPSPEISRNKLAITCNKSCCIPYQQYVFRQAWYQDDSQVNLSVENHVVGQYERKVGHRLCQKPPLTVSVDGTEKRDLKINLSITGWPKKYYPPPNLINWKTCTHRLIFIPFSSETQQYYTHVFFTKFETNLTTLCWVSKTLAKRSNSVFFGTKILFFYT